MSRFDVFKKNYEEAVVDIHIQLSDKDYAEYNHLVNWLYNTTHNPYSIFIHNADAGSMDSAEGFSGLCQQLRGAMLDDGDISFPVVNDQPRIAFVWKHEDNIENYVLTEQEKAWKDDPRFKSAKPTTISFLKDAFEFTKAFDAHEIARLKRGFLFDAMRAGEDFAIEHYKDSTGFTLEWLDELPAMREKYSGRFKQIN